MTLKQDSLAARASDLRRAFDSKFGESSEGVSDDAENLLALSVEGEGYAIRLSEIAGLFVDRKIVRLPAPASEFLGIVGIHRRILPVYSLRVLLGYQGSGEAPRWLIVARGEPGVGLAFDRFEGYLRLPTAAIHVSANNTLRPHLPATVQTGGGTRNLIRISSIVQTLTNQASRLGMSKEH